MAESAIQSLPLTEEAISARLERLPLTSWYRRIMLIVGMAGFFDAFDALTIAFVLPVLIPLWHIEPGRNRRADLDRLRWSIDWRAGIELDGRALWSA